MKKYFAAVVLAVCLVSPALADEDISPERLALAKQVMELNGSSAAFDNYDKNLDLMVSQLLADKPNVDEKVVADLKKIVVEEFNAYRPTLVDGAIKIYARHFSESDLRALIVFYKTEAGQHFASEMPKLTAENVQLMAPFVKHLVERVKQYVADKAASQKTSQDQKQDQPAP